MKDFFQLKELERMCQKEKGITSMSVKEILQSLVDDGMVDTDKIGTCVYFWAFPSKASQKRQCKLEELGSRLEQVEKKCRTTEELVQKAQVGRESNEDRENVLRDLAAGKRRREEVLGELEKYKACDPEVMEEMRRQARMAKDAANRWTDNIFSSKSWIKSKFSFDTSVIDKQFGIPEDFDYID
ncbi:hypothetical protein NP493_799g05016 [Ridgeia piscesae]|uniref:Meiotic nuclear division protein 1 homolog n=1 Tax=Ridgeia piscesae TaxID=27915 RepID=A0AAD9KMU4_RIDPI|nr:hypothetical protein NP493_799g05016 [Ridgeia piscesae]